MVSRVSTLILGNIIEALVDLVGEEAVTTVIRVAIQRTAEELLSIYGVKSGDLNTLSRELSEIMKKELDVELKVNIQENGNRIVLEIENCKFGTLQSLMLQKVSNVLKSRKLCILALLCLSLIEKILGKRYDVGTIICESGKARIEILSPELYLARGF